jgi:predicted HTH domain antitoxin
MLRYMQITVQLPDDLASHSDPAREALEAMAIEGYRSGALSAYETRVLLGLETREQLDEFLKQRQIWEHAYSTEDMKNDAAGFTRHP